MVSTKISRTPSVPIKKQNLPAMPVPGENKFPVPHDMPETLAPFILNIIDNVTINQKC